MQTLAQYQTAIIKITCPNSPSLQYLITYLLGA